MTTKLLIVESSRALQRDLEDQIRSQYPELEPTVYLRKAADIPQITEIVIGGATLVVSIIALALQIRDRQAEPKSKLDIEINDGERSLKIDAVEQRVDINKIVEDFFKE
jgi:hypothetical protein